MSSQRFDFTGHKLIKLTISMVFIIPIILMVFTQTAQAASVPLKVVGRFLQDANGHNIMMRGVNIPVYKSGWADDLNGVAAAVATTKTNAVRLEWWANPPAGTSQYTPANLDRAITKYASLGILPVIELHDLTFQYGHNAKTGANSDGNDQTLFANTITRFWTRADILSILIKHENHLVINLANEWGSSTYSDGTSTANNFIANYTKAITAMRAAGIKTPLMIDAPSGFEYQFVLDNGQAILKADPQHNTLLSVHAYWAASYYSDASVNAILNRIKTSGLPILLGEASSNAWTTIPCDPVHYGNLLTTANADQIGYLMWAWYEDGTCGLNMNITVNANGVTVPTRLNPGFGYNVLNGAGYGINTAIPMTSKVMTNPLPPD
jgi:mannan endo-1,4-beta-mannosidase